MPLDIRTVVQIVVVSATYYLVFVRPVVLVLDTIHRKLSLDAAQKENVLLTLFISLLVLSMDPLFRLLALNGSMVYLIARLVLLLFLGDMNRMGARRWYEATLRAVVQQYHGPVVHQCAVWGAAAQDKAALAALVKSAAPAVIQRCRSPRVSPHTPAPDLEAFPTPAAASLFHGEPHTQRHLLARPHRQLLHRAGLNVLESEADEFI